MFTCVSWLAPHQLLQLSGWAVISQWTVTFWKLAALSSSLSLCISVSPHHSGGRPTKAFVLQWAVRQKLHKYADSVLLMEGKKEIEKRKGKAKTEEGRKIQLWKRKGSVEVPVLCVWDRTCWIKRKTGRYVVPGLRDRVAVQDESSAGRFKGKERLCGLRRDGWMEGSGMLCHLLERAV